MHDLEVRVGIFDLEKIMLDMPQLNIPVTHTFCDGMYARCAVIPAGATVTGAIHRQDNLNIMVSGELMLVTEDGEQCLSGFNIIPSKAGVKRVAHAIKDTIWVTILKTDLTDHVDIEKQLVTNDIKELIKIKGE